VKRALTLTLSALVFASFVWLSAQVYLLRTAPEENLDFGGDLGWILGPPAKALDAAATAHLARALELLNDTASPATERISGYRRELEQAETLLLRSLRAQPTQVGGLSRLAAIRWELRPPVTDSETEELLSLIRLAAEMAPRTPTAQQRLGELLFKMGRRDEAHQYLARAVDLDIDVSKEIVNFLTDNFYTAAEVRSALPDHSRVLIALARVFRDEGAETELLDALDIALEDPPIDLVARLLGVYSNASLRIGGAARLLDRVE